MGIHRSERLEHEIREEVRRILLFEVADPRIHNLTVTRVKITKDLGLARIYFETASPDRRPEVEAGLEKARPFVRRLLAGRLRLRIMPQIEFFYDETSEEIQKLERLFKGA